MISLTERHTFGLSANCPDIQTIKSVDGLVTILNKLKNQGVDENYLVLGEGSNTIFTEDINMPVLVNSIKGIEYTKTNVCHKMKVGAGENWHELVKWCIENHIYGFENLALIPGSVGAAPIQNIGAYGIEIERFIDNVEFFDTDNNVINTFTKKECLFGYRDSVFKHQKLNQRIITHVMFSLPVENELVVNYSPLDKLDNPTPQTVFEEVVNTRNRKLPNPTKIGNSGSFYKNPVITEEHLKQLQLSHPDIPWYPNANSMVKVPAAWLIDKLGFKGTSHGQIGCHKHQPLVLVNLGKGTGEELLYFAKLIKQKVKESFDINLENEVRIMGADGLIIL